MLSMWMPQTDTATAALLGASTPAGSFALGAFGAIRGTHAGSVVRQRKTAGDGNVRPLSLLDGPSG